MSKQLSDEQIRGVIESLRKGDQKITGLAVRTELRRLFGMPGGVDRIYRLIGEVQSGVHPEHPHKLNDEIALLKQQLAEAVKRTELAEYREQAHQEKWAMEIDLLRQQLRAAQVDTRKLSEAQNQVLELRREVHRLTSN
jgi:hypothetical protein